MKSVENNQYKKLANIGSQNGTNRHTVRAADGQVGVYAETSGQKKATTVSLVIPTKRHSKGSRRATFVTLTGSQARELYETLGEFYEVRDSTDYSI